MGLSLSLLSKLGVPGVNSLIYDQFYQRFFEKIEKFEEFHIAFIDLCKILNDVMPGKHFKAPTAGEIKEFYDNIWSITPKPQRKEELTKFVTGMVAPAAADDKAVIITGMVAPAAAVVLKNSAENIPQVKRFKLHLIPNFVFVPTFTFLAIAGVQLMQVSKKSKQHQQPGAELENLDRGS